MGFYRKDDPTQSIVDPVLKAKYDKAIAPLNAFSAGLGNLSERLVAGQNVKACLENLLRLSANRDGLLGQEGSSQGHFLRQWTLVTLAAVKFKAGTLDKSTEARTRQWMVEVADKVVEFHEERGAAKRNNHFYWAVLGVGLTGMLTDNEDLIRFAEHGYRSSLKMISEKGLLAPELKRGERAALYHAFAAQPLALYRVFREAYGFKPIAEEPRLDTLIARVKEAKKDRALFQRLTGVKQLSIGEQAWLGLAQSFANGGTVAVQGQSDRIGGSFEGLRRMLLQQKHRAESSTKVSVTKK